MPVWLEIAGDSLVVKLAGIDSKQEFQDELKRFKEAGTARRWNPDEKRWEVPLSADNALKLMNALQPVASMEVQSLVKDHQLDIAQSLITDIGTDAELQHPVLRTCLFPYQRAFVAWAQDHPHSLLCDEMGVGKTIQALGTVHEAAWKGGQSGPSLVIVPNGLRRNWRTAIIHGPRLRGGEAQYPDWPSADVRILDGANAAKRRAQLAEPADFYIINWEKLRSDAQMLADAHEWFAIIADEAHRAKNRKAQQTKGLWKLTAPIQIAMTGTPVMNTPDELWPLLRWVRPEQYGADNTGTKTTFWQFHYTYVDDYPTKFGRVMRGVKNADDLRFELGDKMVRRTKVEVLPDLPEKLPPTVIEVELNSSERRLYAEATEALFLDAANLAERLAREELGDMIPEGDLLPSQEDVLRKRVEEKAEELAAQPLERLAGLIENGAARMTALRQITARAKAREAVELIRDNPTKPFVTFTWYVEPAQWIAEQLRADKLRVGLAAGAGGPDASEEAKLFQAEEYDQFVGTISKGGTGLDLYRSDTVIMADLDWVPDINDQAVDRLHRQGQTNDVSTIILQVPDTVDTGSVAEANAFKTAIKRELFGRA